MKSVTSASRHTLINNCTKWSSFSHARRILENLKLHLLWPCSAAGYLSPLSIFSHCTDLHTEVSCHCTHLLNLGLPLSLCVFVPDNIYMYGKLKRNIISLVPWIYMAVAAVIVRLSNCNYSGLLSRRIYDVMLCSQWILFIK